jgi:DNA-binding IclR family transcriptional regulator
LHAGSPGKLLLAYLSDIEIDNIIIRTGMTRYTDQTPTSKKHLKKDITKIRKEGFAVSFGEITELAIGLSTPVRKYGGDVIASLTFSWIANSPEPKKINEHLNLIKEAANNISREMGYLGLPEKVRRIDFQLTSPQK